MRKKEKYLSWTGIWNGWTALWGWFECSGSESIMSLEMNSTRLIVPVKKNQEEKEKAADSIFIAVPWWREKHKTDNAISTQAYSI